MYCHYTSRVAESMPCLSPQLRWAKVARSGTQDVTLPPENRTSVANPDHLDAGCHGLVRTSSAGAGGYGVHEGVGLRVLKYIDNNQVMTHFRLRIEEVRRKSVRDA